MLTIEKYEAYEASIQAVVESGKNAQTGEPFDADKLERNLDITAEEFFAFQNQQALAHAGGKISPDVARVIYAALGGEVQSSGNGGWAKHVTLARKITITNLMGELLAKQHSVKV